MIVKDLGNVCKHVKIHGVQQLESDTARIEHLCMQLSDILEEFGEIDQNFQWSDELSEPRKNIWLNLYGILMDFEKTKESYVSTLGVAKAALLMRDVEPYGHAATA